MSVLPPTDDWLAPAERHPYLIADVFTERPLEGNQLGVFLDARGFGTATMQSLAAELKLAETVFLLPAENGGDVRVRIFTPAEELPFAGHPVLGTAFVVAQATGREEVRLETGAGTVPVLLERRGGAGPAFGRMRQPLPELSAYEHEAELLRALGVERSELPVELYVNGPRHVYVGLADEAAVAAVTPDLPALAELAVGANCFAGAGRFWKNRMFYPSAGVPEDAATGSAAGPLALHLARHGRIGWGEEIEIRQGEEIGRPSFLYARATGSAEAGVQAIDVGGSAVIMAQGSYRIGASSGSETS